MRTAQQRRYVRTHAWRLPPRERLIVEYVYDERGELIQGRSTVLAEVLGVSPSRIHSLRWRAFALIARDPLVGRETAEWDKVFAAPPAKAARPARRAVSPST